MSEHHCVTGISRFRPRSLEQLLAPLKPSTDASHPILAAAPGRTLNLAARGAESGLSEIGAWRVL